MNFTTPQGDWLHFQGADVPAKYDLVNWQRTPEGTHKLVLVGRVDGFDLLLDESAIQWSTTGNRVRMCVRKKNATLLAFCPLTEADSEGQSFICH